MTTRFTAAQLAELTTLATSILEHFRAALRGHDMPDEFFTNTVRLRDGYGPRGAAHAVRAWLDTVITASPTIEYGREHVIAFTNEAGTGFHSPHTVQPEYRWAAAALSARIADDQVTLYQLIDQLPTGVPLTRYLVCTADICAGVLNAYEQPGTAPYQAGDVVLVKAPS